LLPRGQLCDEALRIARPRREEVVLFAGILRQVEQMFFDGRAFGEADELQRAVAHGPPSVVAAPPPPEQRSGLDRPPRFDSLQDIDSVERSAFGRLGAGQGDDGARNATCPPAPWRIRRP
jgi:hypothetical protein